MTTNNGFHPLNSDGESHVYLTFNTGRLYQAYGQVIAARELTDDEISKLPEYLELPNHSHVMAGQLKVIAFLDMSRMIDGLIVSPQFTQRHIMAAYDHSTQKNYIPRDIQEELSRTATAFILETEGEVEHKGASHVNTGRNT